MLLQRSFPHTLLERHCILKKQPAQFSTVQHMQKAPPVSGNKQLCLRMTEGWGHTLHHYSPQCSVRLNSCSTCNPVGTVSEIHQELHLTR